jgi:lysophospholipase L1-like esterase
MPGATAPSRLRLLGSALLALALVGGTAAHALAGPPEDRGKPDRGRDAYVAMGDSFAAGTGTGLPDLDPACQRSSLAYGPIIDAERFDTSLSFVACGFGVTTEGLAAQLPALDRQTDFVTVSVGGNDLGFATLAGTCILGTTEQCLGLAGQAKAIAQTVLPGRLDAAYAGIQDRVRRAEVIVVGYPRFFAEDYVGGSPECPGSLGITTEEAVALNDLVDTLDLVIAERAAAARFTYLSVVEAFTGHDMCAAEPWINGVLPATPLETYHPTAAGHRDGFAPLVLEAMETREPWVSQVPRP